MINNLEKYGLAKKEIRSILLSETHIQYTPNREPFYSKFFMKNNVLDTRMIYSPHKEIADLYFKKGEKFLRNNYKNTKYYEMCCSFMDKKDISIEKIINLCKSLKRGYLRPGYDENYIVVLEKSFAETRFNRHVPVQGYEVFMGHHRIGVLLSLNNDKQKVMIVKDMFPGTCYSYGKIQRLCERN